MLLNQHKIPNMAAKKECRFCAALESVAAYVNVAEAKDGELIIGGKKLTVPQMEELGREVMLLEQMNLWKILKETVKSQALRMGVVEAKDFDQLLFAKAMLHMIGVQESLVEIVKKEYNSYSESKDMASRVAN